MVWTLVLMACMKGGLEPPVDARRVTAIEGIPSRVAFGSCARQGKPQPILDRIVAERPDLMVYLGDNVYLDTEHEGRMHAKYRRLLRRPEFGRLRAAVPTVATWDDHDLGANDANREYPKREASKAAFVRFWGLSETSDVLHRPGIYDVHEFTNGERTLQVIMLDTRWFLDPLQENPPDRQRAYDFPFKHDYQPDHDETRTILGEAQWAWLRTQLERPADLRLIASSIQFGHTYNGYESWNNRPHEKDRLQRLIRDTGAEGVVVLSGDVHWGELSRLEPAIVDYPLYDMTSSGLNQIWKSTEYNGNRVGEVVDEEHFGLLDVDWSVPDPTVRLRLMSMDGKALVDHAFPLSTLSPQSPKN